MIPKVVIIGAGFGGLGAALGLRREAVQLTVIDRSNHHLFQPLLYQVATASLSPAQIAYPIRSVLRKNFNTEVLMVEVTGIDKQKKEVIWAGGRTSYDYLVVATGSGVSYFGHSEWEGFAPGLKTIPDAIQIRQQILLAFERAEAESDPQKQKRLLSFVLIGGGPTGVEMAGAIAELAKKVLAADFRKIDPRLARVVLVEAGPRLLATFPESLSINAQNTLKELGVEVRTNTRVSNIDKDGVWIGEECLSTESPIWTAGVTASPAGKWLGTEVDKMGRVKVGPHLNLLENPEIFVIGDTAFVEDGAGQPLPGLAPVAMQQGKYVAKFLKAKIAGSVSIAPFRYRNKGNLATIGRSAAVADLGFWTMTGFMGWMAWLLVHIYYLIGFKNRMLVLIEWAWAYVTFQRGARLITSSKKSMG